MKTAASTAEDSPGAAGAFASPDTRHAIPKPLAERVGYLLARAQLGIRGRAEDALVPFGLGPQAVDECSPKHVGCLLVIADQGPLSQQELGEAIDVDRTTIVAVVDWLESQDFVERKRNPADRRAYALEITAAGRRWLKDANQAVRGAERDFLSPLDPSERKQLVDLLQRLITR
jgi:DNA-binding MarR family transcriptional regulator